MYSTKAGAEAARAAARTKGTGQAGSREKKAGAGQGRGAGYESVVVTIDVALDHTTTRSDGREWFEAVALNGADTHAALSAYQTRDYRVLGARWEVSFALTKELGRWGVATVHRLSSGNKTLAQVANVKGAQVWDSLIYVDKWLTAPDVAGAENPQDESGNSLVKEDALRHCVIAVEATAAVRLTVKLHVTLSVKKAAAGSVTDL